MPPRKGPEAAEAYHLRGFECLCGNVRMASRALSAVYDRFLGHAGLNANQMAVLWCIVAREPVPMGEIAATLVMEKSTVTRNVAVLQAMGFVQSVPGRDARHRLVSSTARGAAAFTAAIPHWEAAQDAIAEALGATTFTSLVKDTKRVAAVLRTR